MDEPRSIAHASRSGRTSDTMVGQASERQRRLTKRLRYQTLQYMMHFCCFSRAVVGGYGRPICDSRRLVSVVLGEGTRYHFLWPRNVRDEGVWH